MFYKSNKMVNLFVRAVIILGLVSFSQSSAPNGAVPGGLGSINKATNVNSARRPAPDPLAAAAMGAGDGWPEESKDADSVRFDALSLEDQVRLLSKQLNALTYQRREDYKMLENSLKKYVRKNAAEITDAQIREELDQLREVQQLCDTNNGKRNGVQDEHRSFLPRRISPEVSKPGLDRYRIGRIVGWAIIFTRVIHEDDS
uniref:Uncharacterized protein n=1 Tax=Anopheles atroparvus TaxID=41427 RepID=A0A182IX73_ANOAO